MRLSSALPAICRPSKDSGLTGAAYRTLKHDKRLHLLRFRSCRSLRRHWKSAHTSNRSRQRLPTSARTGYDCLLLACSFSISARAAMAFPNLASAAARSAGIGGGFFISAAVVGGRFPDSEDLPEIA